MGYGFNNTDRADIEGIYIINQVFPIFKENYKRSIRAESDFSLLFGIGIVEMEQVLQAFINNLRVFTGAVYDSCDRKKSRQVDVIQAL